MTEIIKTFFSGDLISLIKLIGPLGVWGVIFAESGLLIGFFLPGDSLIFTAGLLASPKIAFFSIWPILLGSWVAAIIGDNVGYEFGKRVGKRLFTREKSLLFNPSNLLKAQEFYEKNGGKAIVLARFIPIVRTFAPMVAGIGHMDHKRFTFFNAIGGTLWVWGLTFAGYFLGEIIPDVDRYLLPILALIIFFSIAPPLWHIYKGDKDKWNQKLADFFKLLKYRFLKK